MIFHLLTFARSHGEYRKPRAQPEVFNTPHGTWRMLMNDQIILDRYYCINSAQTKEIMVHYILQPGPIFICVKAFILMLVLGRLQLLIKY